MRMALLAGRIAKSAHGGVIINRHLVTIVWERTSKVAPCRMRDDRGLPMGPYRVWLQERGYPGLAMSRAIGDGLASLYATAYGPPLDITPHAWVSQRLSWQPRTARSWSSKLKSMA